MFGKYGTSPVRLKINKDPPPLSLKDLFNLSPAVLRVSTRTMVGDAEQQLINCVKEVHFGDAVDLMKGGLKRPNSTEEKILLQIPPYSGDCGDLDFGEDGHDERGTTGPCTVKQSDDAAYMSFHSPAADDFSFSISEDCNEESSDYTPTKFSHQCTNNSSGKISAPFEEIFRIYGLNFWEEFGRPFSSSASSRPASSPSETSCDTDGHRAVDIMDNEAVDQRLLTESFLNALS